MRFPAIANHVFRSNFTKKYLTGIIISGNGPDAFFYVGKIGTTVSQANSQGIKIPYPNKDSTEPLGRYSGVDVTLTLPDNVRTSEIAW